MTLLLAPKRLDVEMRRAGWYFLIGFALFGAAFAMNRGLTMTAMTTIALGALCAGLLEWRRTQWLWIMAGAFLVMFLPMYAGLVLLQWFSPSAGRNVWFAADLALSAWAMGKLSRVLLSVIVQNWRAFHPPAPAG